MCVTGRLPAPEKRAQSWATNCFETTWEREYSPSPPSTYWPSAGWLEGRGGSQQKGVSHQPGGPPLGKGSSETRQLGSSLPGRKEKPQPTSMGVGWEMLAQTTFTTEHCDPTHVLSTRQPPHPHTREHTKATLGKVMLAGSEQEATTSKRVSAVPPARGCRAMTAHGPGSASNSGKAAPASRHTG